LRDLKAMRRFALAAIPLGFLWSGIAVNAGETSVHLTVISCMADAASAPIVRVSGWPIPGEKQTPPPMFFVAVRVKGEAGVYIAAMDLVPNTYAINAAGPKCKSSLTTLGVFPSKIRHATIVTAEQCCAFPTLYGHSVAVSVPRGVSVAVIPAAGTGLPIFRGTSDDNITYFDNLPAGRYAVEVLIPYALACISLDVPNYLTGASSQEYLELNMTDIAPLLRVATLQRKCRP
jgi:hypothetical protein